MPNPSEEDRLSKRHYLLVILRLLIDEENQLVQGDVLDDQGNRQRRFRAWSGLPTAIQAWLAERQLGDSGQKS